MKGYINEMALCLEDEDERISSLAKLFFHELSKKGKLLRIQSGMENFKTHFILSFLLLEGF